MPQSQEDIWGLCYRLVYKPNHPDLTKETLFCTLNASLWIHACIVQNKCNFSATGLFLISFPQAWKVPPASVFKILAMISPRCFLAYFHHTHKHSPWTSNHSLSSPNQHPHTNTSARLLFKSPRQPGKHSRSNNNAKSRTSAPSSSLLPALLSHVHQLELSQSAKCLQIHCCEYIWDSEELWNTRQKTGHGYFFIWGMENVTFRCDGDPTCFKARSHL